MVLFLLPLIFNPTGLAFSWLPFLYLSTWPLIVQTSGRETLMTHAVVLMLFVVTCDVTRRLMLKFIGFDLISLPAGLALLIALATDKGSALLSFIRPIFSGVLAFVEPLFLVLEIYVFLNAVTSFNRWLAKYSQIRDEDSQDLSNWEPPLTRGSILVRGLIILLALFSYVGVYIIVQECKEFLGPEDGSIPLIFNHAIAALVTLQLITISMTIYREDGILSESAMICLLASVPIFIASLSYYHAKQTHLSSSSNSWTSYFPFSLFFGSSSSPAAALQDDHGSDFDATLQADGRHNLDFSSGSLAAGSGDSLSSFGRHLDFGQVESSLLGGFLLDGQSKRLLSSPLKQLVMIINSILGLSVDKMAKHYFSPDFWYILLGRAICIGCWTMNARRTRRSDFSSSDSTHGNSYSSQEQTPFIDFMRSLVTRTTIVKLLLILAYSQMLIQQIDNQAHLIQDLKSSALSPSDGYQISAPSSCCHDTPGLVTETTAAAADSSSSVSEWFNCMWTSAKACSSSSVADAHKVKPLFVRILISMIDSCVHIFDSIMALALLILHKLASIHLLLHSLGAVWFARWRSPIVHRLLQSILVQASHMGSLLLSGDANDESEELFY